MGLSSNKRRGRPFRDELTVLEYIADNFLKPLVAYAPDGVSKFTFLEELMGLGTRFIGTFEAKRDLKLPGLFVLLPHHLIQGYGYRRVKKGTKLYIRTDEREPNRIEIEADIGPGSKTHSYVLTSEEFRRILRYLKPCDTDAEEIKKREVGDIAA